MMYPIMPFSMPLNVQRPQTEISMVCHCWTLFTNRQLHTVWSDCCKDF